MAYTKELPIYSLIVGLIVSYFLATHHAALHKHEEDLISSFTLLAHPLNGCFLISSIIRYFAVDGRQTLIDTVP